MRGKKLNWHFYLGGGMPRAPQGLSPLFWAPWCGSEERSSALWRWGPLVAVLLVRVADVILAFLVFINFLSLS